MSRLKRLTESNRGIDRSGMNKAPDPEDGGHFDVCPGRDSGEVTMHEAETDIPALRRA
jgi:hypothetical protein